MNEFEAYTMPGELETAPRQWLHPRQPEISLVQMRDLPGHQGVDLALVILIVGETLVNLGAC